MECQTCKFFIQAESDPGIGTCRRYPPWGTSTDLPVVEVGFWCGDFESLEPVVLKADPNGPTDAEVRAAGIFGEEPVTNAEVPTVGELHAEATRAKAVNAAAFSQTVLDVLKRNSVRKIPDLDDDGRVELYLALRSITDS